MAPQLQNESQTLVGGDVPANIRKMIDAAKAAPREHSVALLWAAQAVQPDCLPIYYLLYKLHAQRGELPAAERAANMALYQAGKQAGLPTNLNAAIRAAKQEASAGHAAAQGAARFAAGPARFWLFTLKALTFILSRAGVLRLAQDALAAISHFDPHHSTGSEVTAALVRAAVDEREG